jgi:hypothetical protein
MIETAGRTAMEGMRGGIRGIRKSGGRALGKMGIRTPAGGPIRRIPGPGLAALLAAAAALGIAALVLYLRKRRQVAEHYNMGEDWEAEAAGVGDVRTFHA